MSEDDRSLPDLDASLARLYDAERRLIEDPSNAIRERLAARLGGFLGPGDGGGNPPEGSSSASGRDVATATSSGAAGGGSAIGTAMIAKAAGLLAAGTIAGAVGHAALATPRVEVRYVDRVVTIMVDAGLPAEASPVAPEPAPVVENKAPPVASSRAAVAVRAPVVDNALAQERALIEAARSAVARRDGASALAATERHARAFPAGQLAEERSALAVQALALAGRSGEAKERAAQFRKNYPNSVFLAVVDDVTH
jgi:hypothetical protein